MNKRKILLVCGDSNATINFRRELILFLLSKDFDIVVTCGDSERKEDIEKLGVTFVETTFNNRDKNLFKLRAYHKEIYNIIKSFKPEIVFSFQLKPNIVAPRVCHKLDVHNCFAMMEGMGDPFQPKNFIGKLIRIVVSHLLKKSFNYCKKVFVLNKDDKNELIQRKICHDKKLILIPGIGIDTKAFVPNTNLPQTKTISMFARLIQTKGIKEFCEIAKIVRGHRKDIVFQLYGKESQLKEKDLHYYITNNYINYLGFTDDVKTKISESRIVMLTSYREGMSRIILESMALGRVVIASNVIGNKDLVIDGKTGYLFDLKSIESCADLIIKIIDNDKLLSDLGMRAREVCVEKYDCHLINKVIYNAITEE